MNIKTERYPNYAQRVPANGQHILCYQADAEIIVYQAYNHQVADYAVNNQCFGGTAYSYSRMSWIKPNFLWMMYRCGWADKENQERVLAITITKDYFETILRKAAHTSFNAKYYQHMEEWAQVMNTSEVRLQWDPDHDPFGKKLERRAIQLGLKGATLKQFGTGQIISIKDVTAFVQEQKQYVDKNDLDHLQIPVETIFRPADVALCERAGINIE